MLNRKLQKERQAKTYGEHKNATMKIDSMFAKTAANGSVNEK